MKKLLLNFTNEERFAISFFGGIILLMSFFMVCRFCGIGYFAKTYSVHEYNFVAQELILFVLKWFDLYFVLKILCKIKFKLASIISFAWANIYWFVNCSTTCFALDLLYMLFIAFVISKFEFKRIGYGLALIIVLSIYQFIMMSARYQIDLVEKFNYIAMIESVIDYKLFIVSIYFLVKFRRLRMEKKVQNLPNAEEREYGGGGCFLFWGKFDTACEIIGKIIVAIVSLGIVPIVFKCKKLKYFK